MYIFLRKTNGYIGKKYKPKKIIFYVFIHVYRYVLVFYNVFKLGFSSTHGNYYRNELIFLTRYLVSLSKALTQLVKGNNA